MGGIFLGFLCAVILIAVLGRLRAAETPSGALAVACWTLMALTGLDGLNAFLADGSLPHLYAPSTVPRLLTGLGAGLALGLMAIPVVASVVWASPAAEHSVEDGVELASGLALAGLVSGLILAGVGVLLWPIAMAMLCAVVLAFGATNLYVVALLRRGRIGAECVADLRGALVSSFGLVLLELVGLAATRDWLRVAFGFTWGI